MNFYLKWIILITLVVGAIFSYKFGFAEGVWTLVALGMLFEGAFWLGLIAIDDD